MLNQYAELFQIYDNIAAENQRVRQQRMEEWRQQRRVGGGAAAAAGESSIQASMRHSQFTRVFWSKRLWLCWLSTLLVVLLFVRHSTHNSNSSEAAAFGRGSMGHTAGVYWGENERFSSHFLRRRSNHNKNSDKEESNNDMNLNQSRFVDSDHSSLLGFTVPSTLQKQHIYHPSSRADQMREQYAGYSEPQPSVENDEGGGLTFGATAQHHKAQHDGSSDEPEASPPTVQNPASTGWTPSAFPNPISNPIRCAIAYLPQYATQPPPNGGVESGGGSSTSMDNGEMMSPQEIQQMQQQQPHPLRLCDPDWVLGGANLEQVALAMHNFTAQFGRERHDELVLQRQEELESALPGEKPRHRWVAPWVDLGIATARKMDLATVLRDSSYYAYEDDDDMVNDAAQLFAHGLHDAWWPGDETDDGLMSEEHGILIFLSIQDRVCYISAGAALSSILPWWRLDSIVNSMKPAERDRDYGAAVLQAVEELSNMLRAGPPSMADRLHDFCARFGVVIIFAAFTFFFGAWGEYRDRRKRFQFAEERSQLKGTDREKASLLQQGYKTQQCPICLESFQSDKAAILTGGPKTDDGDNDDDDEENDLKTVQSEDATEDETANVGGGGSTSEENAAATATTTRDNLDSFGIPLLGADGKRIKMLRCGHIFCESCWKSWVHSGCGNPCLCPVCRQDIGKAPRHHSGRRGEHSRRSIPPAASPAAPANADGAVNLPIESDTHPFVGVVGSRRRIRNAFWESHPSYDSVAQSRRMSPPLGGDSGTTGLERSNASDEEACASAPDERQPLLRPSS